MRYFFICANLSRKYNSHDIKVRAYRADRIQRRGELFRLLLRFDQNEFNPCFLYCSAHGGDAR